MRGWYQTWTVGLMGVAGTVSAQPVVLPPAPAGVQVSTEYSIEFATIGAPGNAGFPTSTLAWTGSEYQGRGSVAYEFRMARTEITTAQWMTFVNTFSNRTMPQSVRSALGAGGAGNSMFYAGPAWWGAERTQVDPQHQQSTWGLRTDAPNAGMIPVYGITWRQAAVYCNWLHGGCGSDWNSLLGGAYDTSTWGTNSMGHFTDAITHEVGARFWIPNLDEWHKAAFFDPNRNGQNSPGWWNRVNSSDAVPTPGQPGEPGAATSAGIPESLIFNPNILDIPLGAYPSAMSPWGLLDTSGGTQEILEDISGLIGMSTRRLTAGGHAGAPNTGPISGDWHLQLSTHPFAMSTVNNSTLNDFYSGLRIAAAIPVPSTLCIIIASASTISTRRRRRP